MTAPNPSRGCGYCAAAGEIELDNNGPIVACPVCSGARFVDLADLEASVIQGAGDGEPVGLLAAAAEAPQ